MKNLAEACGFQFSIQEGQAVFLRPGEGIGGAINAIILDPEHGLIGNAEEGEDRERHAAIVARSLMNSALRPGAYVLLTSRNTGTVLCRVYSVKHHGDTHGQEWYSDLVLNQVPSDLSVDSSNSDPFAGLP
jgi:hypothetical protein